MGFSSKDLFDNRQSSEVVDGAWFFASWQRVLYYWLGFHGANVDVSGRRSATLRVLPSGVLQFEYALIFLAKNVLGDYSQDHWLF